MNTQQPNGGYGLRQNIVTTNHAPGSIHCSATRRKNHPFGPQPGTVPQPDFGVMNAQGAPATEVLLVPPLFLLDSGHSGGIRWSRIWQEGLLIFSFRCILSPAEFGHSGIETRTGIRLFVQLLFV